MVDRSSQEAPIGVVVSRPVEAVLGSTDGGASGDEKGSFIFVLEEQVRSVGLDVGVEDVDVGL